MKRPKKCRYCRRWYHPSAQNYRREKSCGQTSCRRQRRCEALRRWRRKNPLYEQSRWPKKRSWRQKQGAAYMRAYRKNQAAYVSRNRLLQKRRDEKRRFLVNRNDWNSLWRDKIERIRCLRLLVNRNDWMDALGRQIDGICSLLDHPSLLVNRNDRDKWRKFFQNSRHETPTA